MGALGGTSPPRIRVFKLSWLQQSEAMAQNVYYFGCIGLAQLCKTLFKVSDTGLQFVCWNVIKSAKMLNMYRKYTRTKIRRKCYTQVSICFNGMGNKTSDVVLETKVLVSRRLEDKNTSLGLGLGLET